jgi:hypothetical protein
LALYILISASFFSGCAGQTQATSTTTGGETTATPALRGVDRLIQNVVDAPDGTSEAKSLARLRDWMSEHRMMYHVAVENVQTRDIAAPTGAESRQPLRVTVEMYQGQQIFRTFQFVPRDNRNLTQLGLN